MAIADIGLTTKNPLKTYQENAVNIAPDISNPKTRRQVFRNAIKESRADVMKACLDKGLKPAGRWWEDSNVYYQKTIEQLSEPSEYKRSKALECLSLFANHESINFNTEYIFKEEWALNYSNVPNKGDAVAHVIYASRDEDTCAAGLNCLFENKTARVEKKHIDLLKSTSKYKNNQSLGLWDKVEELLNTRHIEGLGLGNGQRALKI